MIASCVELNLQELINHTVVHLLSYLEEVLFTVRLSEEDCNSQTIICDGSQQAYFKQKFGSDSNSDANIFQSFFATIVNLWPM